DSRATSATTARIRFRYLAEPLNRPHVRWPLTTGMRETADSAGAEAGETISSIVEFLPKNHTGTTRGGPSNLPYFSDFVKLLPVGLLCRNLPTNKRKRGKNER